jgi:hypothetical protein
MFVDERCLYKHVIIHEDAWYTAMDSGKAALYWCGYRSELSARKGSECQLLTVLTRRYSAQNE